MSGFTRDNASDTVLKLGTYDGGANVGIDFMNFPSINTSIPTNATIGAASLGVYNNWSWSCTPEDVNVYQVTSGWAGHGLQSYPGANLGALLGTQSFADGYTGCANGPNWANFNVASTVQGWVNGSITNDGLAMAVDANQQTNNYAWKTFYSYDTCTDPVACLSSRSPGRCRRAHPRTCRPPRSPAPRERCGSPGRRPPTWALVARSATTSWTCGTAAPTPGCTLTTPPVPRSSQV